MLLELGHEGSKQALEGGPIGRGERSEQPFFVREMGCEGAVDRRLPPAGEPDENSSSVSRVGRPFHEAGPDEAIDALGHAAGGKHRRFHQLRGIQLVRFAGTTQRREEVEPPGLQLVVGETLRERSVRQVRRAEEPAEQPDRRRVEIGSLRRRLWLSPREGT